MYPKNVNVMRSTNAVKKFSRKFWSNLRIRCEREQQQPK
jgi:hypothetical protein